MSTRDDQIAELRSRHVGLRTDRLLELPKLIEEAYRASSVVDSLAVVTEITDRTPSDFKVLTTSELRPRAQFNGADYYWDQYCRELGRSIATAEVGHVFEVVQRDISATSRRGELNSAAVDGLLREFDMVNYSPSVLVVPISHMARFTQSMGTRLSWTPERMLDIGNGNLCRVVFSNRYHPLGKVFGFDHRCADWLVKLDPTTSSRLTVAIGNQDAPVPGVVFLAETVAKFEIRDSAGFRSMQIESPPDAGFDRTR